MHVGDIQNKLKTVHQDAEEDHEISMLFQEKKWLLHSSWPPRNRRQNQET